MQVSHNIDSEVTTIVEGYGTKFHRGSEELFSAVVVNTAGAVVLASGDQLKLVAKKLGERDSDPLFSVFVTSADLSGGVYSKRFSTITAAVNTLMNVDDDASNDLSDIDIDVTVTYIPTGTAGRTGNTLQVPLEYTPFNPDDDTPVAEPDPIAWLLRYGQLNAGYWTAYQGLTATCLDNFVSADYALGHVIETAIAGIFRRWQLKAGTDATDVPGGFLRCLDYNALTNARLFVEI